MDQSFGGDSSPSIGEFPDLAIGVFHNWLTAARVSRLVGLGWGKTARYLWDGDAEMWHDEADESVIYVVAGKTVQIWEESDSGLCA